MRKVRSYGCRVRLTGLTDDRRVHVPESTRRTKLNETSFKHESRF